MLSVYTRAQIAIAVLHDLSSSKVLQPVKFLLQNEEWKDLLNKLEKVKLIRLLPNKETRILFSYEFSRPLLQISLLNVLQTINIATYRYTSVSRNLPYTGVATQTQGKERRCKMRISPTLYILYLFVFLLVACNRRELTYSPEATITISADWSQSGLNEKEQDYGATAIFYPTDGSTPFVALMGDRTYKTLCLKEGCYNVVLFNRSFDDFGNLCFRGEENYQTLEAYVKKMEIRNESSSERIIMESPDELAADYIEGFEVTSDMPENYSSAITQQSNRNSTRNENSCHLRFTPKKLTQKITVKIRIKGMNNIRKATCTLDGIAESIFLVSRQNSEKTVTQVLRLSNPVYDSGSVTEGTLSTTISVFGFDVEIPHNLHLKAKLVDGKTIFEESFNDLAIRRLDEEDGTMSVFIDMACEKTVPNVKTEGSSGFDADVDKWDDEVNSDIDI